MSRVARARSSATLGAGMAAPARSCAPSPARSGTRSRSGPTLGCPGLELEDDPRDRRTASATAALELAGDCAAEM